MLKFFNIILSKAGYDNNEEMQEGLVNLLLSVGIFPMDVSEADLVDTRTNESVFEVIILRCVETIPGAKDIFKKARDMNEIEYEGLPSLM